MDFYICFLEIQLNYSMKAVEQSVLFAKEFKLQANATGKRSVYLS